MADKFGLHVINSSERIQDNVYNINKVWNRKRLIYDGKSIFNSVQSGKHKFGLYYEKTGNLNLDNDTIAAQNDACLNCIDNNISFGNIKLQGNKCINITKDDYRLLRFGKHVDGYSRYDSHKVYYITDNVDTCPDIVYDENLIKNHEDIVYNSFINGDLSENLLTDKTQFSVEPPTLAIRCFNATLKKGEDLILTFFVDTFDYDSIYKGIIDDTFTVIITDNEGNDLWNYIGEDGEIHHHTLYAGQYTVALDVGNTVGDKWFSIKCINKLGCSSIEYFYDFRIVDDQALVIKNITLSELNDYGITVGENQSYSAAHKNKVLFPKLCNDLKNGAFDGTCYDGIKLFNNNQNIDLSDLDDADNSVYEFDPRRNVNRVTETQVSEAADNDEILLLNDSDLTNIEAPTVSYYLLYYDGSNNIIKRAGNPTSNNSSFYDLDLSQSISSILSACSYSKLEFNKTIVNNTSGAELTISIDSSVTIGNVVKNTPTILDWIRWDGAGVYRNSSGKIRVPWGEEDPSVEASEKKTLATRQLRIHSLESVISKRANLSKEFPEGTGYYYCIYGNNTNSEYETILPNNFIIDLNGCKLKIVNGLGVDSSMRLIYAPGTYGITVKNGILQGMYSPHNIRLAFLMTCQTIHSVWEGSGGLIDACASSYFTLHNVKVYGSHGYETMTSGVGNGSLTVGSTGWNLNNLDFGSTESTINASVKRVKLDGSIDTANVIVKDKDKNSLITDIHPVYNPTLNQQICFITTKLYSINPSNLRFSYKVGGQRVNNASETLMNCDEIFIGYQLKHRYGGAYPYFFVNFYNISDAQEENIDFASSYIKTVKTEYYTAIKIPENATHYNITVYAICNVNTVGSTDRISVLIDSNNKIKYVTDSPISNRFLHTLTEKFTKNFLVEDCVYDDSRTCVLGNCGINYIIRNTEFNHVAATPSYLELTNMIVDIEEHKCAAANILFENCSSTYGPRTDEQGCTDNCTFIQVGFSRFMQMVNCENLSYVGEACDGYFADNIFSQYRIHFAAAFNSHYRVISKRNIVKDQSHHEYISVSVPSIYTSCFREISYQMPAEDSFTVRNVRTTEYNWIAHNLTGRSFKVFGEGGNDYVHDSYTSDFILRLWDLINDYAKDDGTDGWIHFVMCTASDTESVRIGYYADNLFYKENGGTVVYLDGIKYTNLVYNKSNSQYIAIPTRGYHILSYKLNDIVGASTNNRLRTPNPALFIQLPGIIKTTIVDGVQQIMTMADKLGDGAFDLVTHCPIVVKSIYPFKIHIGISGNKHCNIYIPKGCTNAYNNYNYTSGTTTYYPWRTGTILNEFSNIQQVDILDKYVQENMI